MKLAWLILACVNVATPMTANEPINCGTVSRSIAPCIGYLTRGTSLTSACCIGVTNLNGIACSTPDSQEACRCFQSVTKSLGSALNSDRAVGLPSACSRLNIPYVPNDASKGLFFSSLPKGQVPPSGPSDKGHNSPPDQRFVPENLPETNPGVGY